MTTKSNTITAPKNAELIETMREHLSAIDACFERPGMLRDKFVVIIHGSTSSAMTKVPGVANGWNFGSSVLSCERFDHDAALEALRMMAQAKGPEIELEVMSWRDALVKHRATLLELIDILSK